MERLTITYPDGAVQLRDNDVNAAVARLSDYEDTGLMPEEVEACKAAMMGQTLARIIEIEGLSVDRMKELAKAEAEGRLIVLPCKVGDTVYAIRTVYSFIDGTRRREIVECKVTGIILGEDMEPLISYESDSMGYIPAQPGSALYFSREEAEAAIRKEKNEN